MSIREFSNSFDDVFNQSNWKQAPAVSNHSPSTNRAGPAPQFWENGARGKQAQGTVPPEASLGYACAEDAGDL